MTKSASRINRSRARDLLKKLIAGGWYSHDDLAKEIVVSLREIVLYDEGIEPIPLDRQLCLATFVIERVPPLLRAGHALRSQVKSAMAFQLTQVETHAVAPPRSFR